MSVLKQRSTIQDLYRVPGKAELVNGEIVHFMPTGFLPMYAAGEIYSSLRIYARQTRNGYAVTDNAGFRVHLPNRESFSPDAAYHTGPVTGMRFLEGAPQFAAEVRSEGDYGPDAEEKMEAKRADYFAAGTQVVWDVDLQGVEAIVRKYAAGSGAQSPAAVFGPGEEADAEPAVPGWRMPVDDLFPPADGAS